MNIIYYMKIVINWFLSNPLKLLYYRMIFIIKVYYDFIDKKILNNGRLNVNRNRGIYYFNRNNNDFNYN